MIENCKIKLILKTKNANTFETIFNDSPSKAIHLKSATSKEFDKKTMLDNKNHQSEGIRAKIVSEIKKDNNPKKTFKNVKIKQCIIAPCESEFPQFEYCYTFQHFGRRNSSQGLKCQGKRAQYSKQSKSRVSPTKESRALSRPFSSQKSRLRRPSTSDYLTHKKTGYVQLDKFQRKKPWSMNPFHYQGIYMQKLKISLDFYYKVQYANRVSVDLSLNNPNQQRYKVYVGPGNNQFTIQQILRKRFWYEVVYEPKKCDFYWTQSEMLSVHQQQKSLKMRKKIQSFQQPQNPINSEQQKKKIMNKTILNAKILSTNDAVKVQKLIDGKGYQFVYPQLNYPIITNHIPCGQILNERKHVLKNIQEYYEKYKFKDPWGIMPKTFFVCNPTRSDMHFYTDTVLKNKKKLWIIKPGQRANYQNDIQILPGAKIMDKLRKLIKFGDQPWTFLLQQYIQRPFLYKGRKIDLRHFVLITSIGGGLKAYWYYQGYVRTCSKNFKITDLNPLIHLTSDAIQEKAPQYGLHQPENKLTYNDFQRYLQTFDPYQPHSLQQQIIPKMKEITLDLLKASYKKLDPQRKGCNFQIIGLDFLLNQDLQVFLTGVNTNPSLKSDNPVLGKIIPSIIDQSLWLGLDPFLPPKSHYPAGERLRLGADPLYSLKFECIFDQFQL